MVVVIKGKNIKRKLSPLVGESVSEADERGKCEQIRKKRFLQNGIKYLPVILERSEESGQRKRALNTLFAINLCRILC